jgi:hypothetical protein
MTIHRGSKVHALFGDLAPVRQAPDLETAGIGQDWPFPVHKTM